MRLVKTLLGGLMLLLLASPATADPYYCENWDAGTDLAGWTANTTRTFVEVRPKAGNPRGYLFSWGDVGATFDIGAVTREPFATGNYRAKHIVGATFDVRFDEGAFDVAWLRFRYRDFSQNGWMFPFTRKFPLGKWESYQVHFDPNWSDAEARAAGWVQQGFSPSFASTMADVYSCEVRLSGEGHLEAGIDNFCLLAKPPVYCLDVEPEACPNRLGGQEILLAAILAAPGGVSPVDDIVPGSVRLEGVAPLGWAPLDVGSASAAEGCGCGRSKPDGVEDLLLKFPMDEVLRAMSPARRGQQVLVQLSARHGDGTELLLSDFALVMRKPPLGTASESEGPELVLDPDHQIPSLLKAQRVRQQTSWGRLKARRW